MQADLQVQAHPLARVESGKTWFNALPLANPKAAVDAVNLALSALLASDYAGSGAANTLQVLEALREPMVVLSQDLSSRYAGKSLPLSATQRAAFDSNITLAWTLAYIYYSLLDASAGESRELGKQAALIHQRAVFWTAHGLEDHLRACQAFADEDWDLAQFVLQSADRRQLLLATVSDSLQPSGASSVVATYVRLLLLHLAGARSLTTREFECARELAHCLEGEVGLSYVVADGHGAAVDEANADRDETVRMTQTGALVHFLDVAALSKSLLSRQDSLAQGKMPASPAFSQPLGPAALKALIAKLHTAWCSPTNQRQSPRSPGDGMVYAAFEPVAVYALMKRRNYVAPSPSKVYDHHEVANLYLRRGDGPQAGQQMHTRETWNQVKPQLEVWQVLDQSATGMRLARVSGGTRTRQGQLMALRLGDAGVAAVGVVRWAAQTRILEPDAAQERSDEAGGAETTADPAHTVEVGIHKLPGLARAGAARHIGTRAIAQVSAGKTDSTPVLILDNFTRADPGPASVAKPAPATYASAADALPEFNIELIEPGEAADAAGAHVGAPRYSDEATLLLPVGWAREGEVIDFIDGAISIKLRLGAVEQRYGDIERMHFQVSA